METKVCSACKVNKSLSEYNKYKRSKDGLDYRCKLCQRNSNKSWVENNWERKLAQQTDRRSQLLTQLREFKRTAGCRCCPETEPVCLELHHLDPNEKEIDPSSMVSQGWSWERMKSEIDKCVVLCSNCHKKVHAGLLEI